MASFWGKRIKSKKLKQEVAKDLGVEEHKIQELIDGKRHIGGETMDKVLQSINDSEENGVAKDLEILDWYTNVDLKKLRKEWGYGQEELSIKLGLKAKTLNSIEAKYQFRGHITNNIRVLYNFYQNEFNKKLEPLKGNERVRVNKEVKNDDNILNWYNNADLISLRQQFNYGLIELANKLHINSGTLNNIEHHRNEYKKVTDKIQKLYNFYHDESNVNTSVISSIIPLPNVPVVTKEDIENEEVGFNIQPIFHDEIVIKIDSTGDITYMEHGKEIQNITELYLSKVGDEKPILEVKLSRRF